ncbi:MAG TPA: hypothetical protein VMA77_00165 [Solirubrobacteraceae bacterium]|nr:hypothetical protein [Solirubrobacteraceae bacterium]
MEAIPADQIRRRTRVRAMRMVVFAALFELFLVMPFVDRYADAHPTVHFTQHGFIFLGGVLMGWALRDVHRAST